MVVQIAAERMLTIEEVRERLNAGLTLTKKLIGSGAIPSVKVGRLRRVRESDLAVYMAELPVAPVAGTSDDDAAGSAA